MAMELTAAMIEAAKDITIAVIQRDGMFLSHGGNNAETSVQQSIERVTKLYAAVFTEVRASYNGQGSERATAVVN